MMYSQWDILLTCAVAAIVGFDFFGIWLFGLIKKRPIAISILSLLWWPLLLFISFGISITYQVLHLVGLLDVVGDYGLFSDLFSLICIVPSLAMPVFFILLIGFLIWRQPKMYLVCGVNDTSFRDALIYALNKLVLPFKERIWQIRLLYLKADLRVQMAGWRGVGFIFIQPRQHTQRVKEIAAAMNEYYHQTPVKVDYVGYYFFLMLSIFLFVIAASFYHLLN
jgi:hypothetical protein